MTRRRCLLALAALAAAPAYADDRREWLRDGDLVFQTSKSEQSQAIALATGSRWTHMGVVHRRKGATLVLEAGARVRLTPLDQWAARGEGGTVVVKRLRDADQVLTAPVLQRMKGTGRAWLERPYDGLFQWSDRRFYCSELVYKLYERGAGITIGALRPAGSFDLASPVVQAKIRQRFGGKFDVREPVISPQSMFEDPRLVLVYEGTIPR
jgi:hypothetical protein